MKSPKRHTELCRALSKLGYCSRTQAVQLILAGQVCLNRQVCIDPARWVDLEQDQIDIAGTPLQAEKKYYLMLNKPRGFVTTAADEQNRATVYDLLSQHGLPWMSPVGRLDKASEGLLLFSNDTCWAAAITDPEQHIDKVYHVQIDRHLSPEELALVCSGVRDQRDELLRAKAVRILRQGQRNSWVEFVLDEGRNRHLRRLLAALHIAVLRLIRIRIGSVALGTLAKGQFRPLTAAEVQALSGE